MTWFQKKFIELFLSEKQIASIFRHLISTLGGYLGKLGIDKVTISGFESAFLELSVALATLAISYFLSRKQKE